MTNAILDTRDSKVKATAEEPNSSPALSFDQRRSPLCFQHTSPRALRAWFFDVHNAFPTFDGMHFMLVAEAGRIRADECEPSSIGKWWFIDIYDERGRRVAEKHIARSAEIFESSKPLLLDEVGP